VEIFSQTIIAMLNEFALTNECNGYTSFSPGEQQESSCSVGKIAPVHEQA
jgi:hypothetical protein